MFEIPLVPYFDLILFKIEAFRVFSYSAFFIGMVVALFEAERRKLSLKHTFYNVLAGIAGTLVGARFFYFFGPWSWQFSWSISKRFFMFLDFTGTGLVLYGGLIGSMAAIWLYCRLRDLKVMQYLDVFSLSFAIGLAVWRFGCFLAGCCMGRHSELPWAVFRKASQGYIHPTQLYSVIAGLLILAMLMRMRKDIKFDGYLFYWTLAMYSSFRFFIEAFRLYTWKLFGIFTASQIVSSVLFIFAVCMLLKNYRKLK